VLFIWCPPTESKLSSVTDLHQVFKQVDVVSVGKVDLCVGLHADGCRPFESVAAMVLAVNWCSGNGLMRGCDLCACWKRPQSHADLAAFLGSLDDRLAIFSSCCFLLRWAKSKKFCSDI
jgi:hypothetical protein